ncbi:MAG TPA: protein kinase [Bryobacteraceae bacterium]
MTPERWHQIEDLYHAARQRDPGGRAALLERTDPEIRSRVERMLALDPEGQILDRPARGPYESSTEAILGAGSQLGPYKIEALIGVGGMGAVYRATDTRLGREVAIKIPAAHYSERFQMEARAISTLNHPHICSLYDVGPDYLVMEFIEGSTLAAEIGKGPLTSELVARYGAQIADALAEAHSRDIVHRDLKPANVMLTRHGVKLLDFGLAKKLSEAGLTQANAVMGTPAYMAPEQVEGREPTALADLFALGLVLYEMVTGKLPFPGASLGQILSTGSQARVPAPSKQHAEVPAGLNDLVVGLLERDPARRPQSASEVGRALSSLADRLAARPSTLVRALLRPVYAIPAALLLLVLVAGALRLYQHSEQQMWVREQAIPEIPRLAANQPLAAFLLLREAERIEPGDPQLTKIGQSSTRLVSVGSTPAGAEVEIQDYVEPGSWFRLGVTPLKNVRIPNGYFRWKIAKPGSGQFVAAPETANTMQFTLGTQAASAGMDTAPAGYAGEMIGFVGGFAFKLPAFDIDRFEVTNRQYQTFVDEGGYRKPAYWKEKFVWDGKKLAWQDAMSQFRDPTGRPGPSTWDGGHFPPGQADYPVSGVSWYEAAAYAAFADKSLPTLVQWYKVAPSDLVVYRINQSNFNGRGPVPVGTFPGVGPYGTYDLNGNVREWCLNAIDGDRRFILGGAWGTQTYQAYDPEALPPFDRSPLNGFRCVRNEGPLPAGAVAPVIRQTRDFAKAKPVSDPMFQAFRTMYAYDHIALNARSEGVVENTADWTKEKITIDAGYGNERLPLYLFLPKNIRPPYQTVLFFPSARVNTMPSSQNLGDLQFVDYIIKSGRALVYPIYKGTYERLGTFIMPGDIHQFNRLIEQSKEIGRSLDYVETRPDIDKARIAYLGVSQGGADGVIFTALEDRFKTVVLLDGGFFLSPTLPAEDQVNFAPRLKKPVLMINGRYDFTFSPERAQEPMFRMIGTAAADKRRVVFDTPHDVSQKKQELSKEVLSWLDKYLGRVS